MPGLIFIAWIAGAVVLMNAEPEMYDSKESAKAAIENAMVLSEPVDYSKMND